MRSREKDRDLKQSHEKHLWAFFTVVFLGFWLLCSHEALGYKSDLMIQSDIITGIVLIVFGFLALSFRVIIAPWVLVFAGIWLELAPLLFWAPDSVAYLNNTLIGVLVIGLSLLIPGVPGIIEERGKEIPIGWSYNPSSWQQRLPIIICGCIGWFIARYLAAYQLGYINNIWDPFFGDGTKLVITSSIAKSLPVSDAGLGAFAYTLEVLMGAKGGTNRWRTMPWMVVIFALLVVPLGIVSILLIISQPILLHQWCFLCLLAGFCMLIMVVLTIDEMFAVFQFLHLARKARLPFWRTFFKGGILTGIQDDTRTPTFYDNFKRSFFTMWTGTGFIWNLVLSAAVAMWLMFCPSIFHLQGYGADVDHLLGSLIIVFSTLSLAEVARSFRFVNILFGILLIASTWFVNPLNASWNHLLIGVLVILLSLRKGPIKESYGSWSSCIK
jgi:hypothetical protein